MGNTLQKLLLTLFLILISVASGKAQEIQWEPVNDGMWGGTVQQIVPYSENTLFAITGEVSSHDVNRVYRSRDRGNSWEALNTGSPEIAVADLIVFPDGEMLVSTYQPYVLRSSDEGENWTQIPITTPLYRGLALHPSGDILGASSREVFRSVDRGNTWLSVDFSTDSLGYVNDLDITPLGTTLLTTWKGVFRSSDKGYSWSNVGLQDIEPTSTTVASDSSIFLSVRVPGGINRTNEACVFRSQDDGLIWKAIDCPIIEIFGEIRVITNIGSKGEDLILVLGSKVFASSDNGISWHLLIDFGFGSRAHRDSFLWLDDHMFLTMSGPGIIVSEDGGRTWRVVNTGLTATTVIDIAQHLDGTLYALTERTGLFRSQNHGDTWAKVDLGEGPDFFTDLLITEQGDIIAASGSLYRSTDDGLTWEEMSGCGGYTLASAPNGTLYIEGYSFLLYSRDNGETCELQTRELVGYMDLAFASNGDLLAGLNSGQRLPSDGVFRSSDEGVTWEAMEMSPPPPYSAGISELFITPIGTVLAGASGAGIYRSEDGGYTFNIIYEPGLENISAFASAPDGTIYVAARNDIFRTRDEGQSWEAINTGLPARLNYAVMFDDEGFVYVGTLGAGIYRSVQAVGVASESERELPDGIYLKENFPNPFRQSTTIPFFLDRTAPVRVSIYNALGQEVDVVIQKILGPGEHQVQWAPQQQVSGLYFCHMQIDNRVAVRPLMFIH